MSVKGRSQLLLEDRYSTVGPNDEMGLDIVIKAKRWALKLYPI